MILILRMATFKKQLPFWIITASIFIGLIVPVLIQDGMFMDGVLYTAVSKNLAEGYGSFWKPFFSETWNKGGVKTFHEHPPLVFGIQAMFFKILGPGIYTERVYSFFMATVTAVMIAATWRLVIRGSNEMQQLSWLPILFWIITPVCFWAYQNNVQENTMGFFALVAVYFSIRALRGHDAVVNVFISGFFVFLSSLSKGVPGLFPLAVLFIHWAVFRKCTFIKMINFSTLLVIVPGVLYIAAMIFSEEAREGLTFYFNERLLGRIASSPTTNNRFEILARLVSELIPVVVLITVLLVLFRNGKITNRFSYWKKEIIFFLIIGMSASFPLVLTQVQKGFYLIHSFPYYGIAAAFVVAPGISTVLNKINPRTKKFKLFTASTFFLLVIVLGVSASKIGDTSRNNELLHDVYIIGETVPEYEVVTIPREMWNEWDLQCYLIRHFHISVDHQNEHNYFLVRKGQKKLVPKEFEIIPIQTIEYDVYKKE